MVDQQRTDCGERKPTEGMGDLRRHFCLYKVMARTVTKGSNGSKWAERCRCGRAKLVDWTYVDRDTNSPKRTIRWYDTEGNYERTTGDGTSKD